MIGRESVPGCCAGLADASWISRQWPARHLRAGLHWAICRHGTSMLRKLDALSPAWGKRARPSREMQEQRYTFPQEQLLHLKTTPFVLGQNIGARTKECTSLTPMSVEIQCKNSILGAYAKISFSLTPKSVDVECKARHSRRRLKTMRLLAPTPVKIECKARRFSAHTQDIRFADAKIY